MLIDLPRLLWAMLAMLAAATLWDIVHARLHHQPGEQTLRGPDRLLVNLLFFVLTPGLLYAWFYPLVPFSGFRAGLFLALCFFLLGVSPTVATYRLQIPDRAAATLGHLFWLFLKYLLVYASLTQLYQP
jgi:hypothetical protein